VVRARKVFKDEQGNVTVVETEATVEDIVEEILRRLTEEVEFYGEVEIEGKKYPASMKVKKKTAA